VLKTSLMTALLFLAISPVDQSLPQMRMTPAEIQASAAKDNEAGGAAVATGRRKVIAGDPDKAGFYSILVFVPAHTTIPAHSHRDDRVATVVSGEWHFGYGNRFDAAALKTLPPGSVYSEPAGMNHFARTDAEPVIVQISGYGPSDTRYFDPANDPGAKARK